MAMNYKKVPVVYRDPLISNIRSRVLDKDQDGLIGVVGERGAGKSGSAITLAHMLDRDQNGQSRFKLPESYLPDGFKLKPGEVMPRVVWTPEDFLKLVTREKLPRLSSIIFDEIGVAGDSREFMTKKNRMLKQTMETIRSRNLVIFLTAPTLSSFDKSLRLSMSHYINCINVMSPNSTVYPAARVRIYVAQTNAQDGKIYLKYFKFRNPKGYVEQISNYFIPKPPIHLEAPYKRLKEFMQDKLYDQFREEFTNPTTTKRVRKPRKSYSKPSPMLTKVDE